MHLCGLRWHRYCSRIRQAKERMRWHLSQDPTAWINSSYDELFVHDGATLGCDRTDKTVARAWSVALLIKPALCSQQASHLEFPNAQSTGRDGPEKPLLPPSPEEIVPIHTPWASPDKNWSTSWTYRLSLIIETAITIGRRPWHTIHHSHYLHYTQSSQSQHPSCCCGQGSLGSTHSPAHPSE